MQEKHPVLTLPEAINEQLDELLQVDLDRRVDELLREGRYESKLNRWEHKVYSQSGEDGILAEIFRRIGATTRIFAECSPGDGLENNTLYLLTRGWRGGWIERDPARAENIQRLMAPRIEDDSLSLQQQAASPENINALLGAAGLPEEFDLLSVDIDGNDYWVWECVRRFTPRVVAIEYNATFPPDCDWTMEYNPQAAWDGTIRFGASLRALERLGSEKGYSLVGCSLSGVNAFFVRQDLARGRFAEPFTAENYYEPPRYYLTLRRAGHRRSPAWGAMPAANLPPGRSV